MPIEDFFNCLKNQRSNFLEDFSLTLYDGPIRNEDLLIHKLSGPQLDSFSRKKKKTLHTPKPE